MEIIPSFSVLELRQLVYNLLKLHLLKRAYCGHLHGVCIRGHLLVAKLKLRAKIGRTTRLYSTSKLMKCLKQVIQGYSMNLQMQN